MFKSFFITWYPVSGEQDFKLTFAICLSELILLCTVSVALFIFSVCVEGGIGIHCISSCSANCPYISQY